MRGRVSMASAIAVASEINSSPAALWLDGGARVGGYASRGSGWTSYGLFLRAGP